MAHTVTCNDEELIVVAEFVDCDIRESSHNLLLRRKIGALLELEVTNGATERKVAIDSAEVDEAASCAYSCLLALILWLVVERQRLGTAFDAEDRSRITSVALGQSVSPFMLSLSSCTYDVDLVLCNDAYRSSAP